MSQQAPTLAQDDSDCTSAVEIRLKASLARQRLRTEIDAGCFPIGTQTRWDVETLLEEVADLTKRLRSARHAIAQAHSAIDDKQFYARVRDARDRLFTELQVLIAGDFGSEE